MVTKISIVSGAELKLTNVQTVPQMVVFGKKDPSVQAIINLPPNSGVGEVRGWGQPVSKLTITGAIQVELAGTFQHNYGLELTVPDALYVQEQKYNLANDFSAHLIVAIKSNLKEITKKTLGATRFDVPVSDLPPETRRVYEGYIRQIGDTINEAMKKAPGYMGLVNETYESLVVEGTDVTLENLADMMGMLAFNDKVALDGSKISNAAALELMEQINPSLPENRRIGTVFGSVIAPKMIAEAPPVANAVAVPAAVAAAACLTKAARKRPMAVTMP